MGLLSIIGGAEEISCMDFFFKERGQGIISSEVIKRKQKLMCTRCDYIIYNTTNRSIQIHSTSGYLLIFDMYITFKLVNLYVIVKTVLFFASCVPAVWLNYITVFFEMDLIN
jgi:hypothetical protein